ncbi:BN159_2729 family protein [Streptomyces nodosus]|uniref:BN159_2729 family protein n=1 Tax=Streptomyces nodosus TaxID=40318 RepID=UPI0036E33B43
MTATPGDRAEADIERELTEQLAQLARRFIAGLHAHGRLVETGGAQALRRLQEQHHTPHSLPEAVQDARDAHGAADTFAGPAPAPALHDTNAPSDAAPRGVADAPVTVPPARQSGMIDPAARTAAADDPRTAGDRQVRAAAAAAMLQAGSAGRLEVLQIVPDHDHIAVHIRAFSLSDWEYWLALIGAPLGTPTVRAGDAQTATGHIDGVDVHLTGHEVPRLLDEAAETAREPFHLAGRVYDLARAHLDRHGQTWLYLGQRQQDDTPLLALGGTGGPVYPLTSIITTNGPLIPVETDPTTPTRPGTEHTP